MPQPSDLEQLKAATPYLRSILAFCIYLRRSSGQEESYKLADFFIMRLTEDVKNS